MSLEESCKNIYRLWRSHVTVIVTGASKGFGKAVVYQILNSFNTYHKRSLKSRSLKLILSARDEVALDILITEIKTEFVDNIIIQKVIGSMEEESTLNKFKLAFESALAETDQVMIVHNAGSLGDPSKLVNDYRNEDLNLMTTYFCSNVASVISLTGIFLQIFERCPSKIVVNVSSLAALSPLKGLSLYCAGKAARDAYFRSLALETGTDVRCVSYAPGPLKTAMAEELKLKSHMKEFFEDPSNILEPEVSAKKILEILEKDTFINGSHLDFYDVA